MSSKTNCPQCGKPLDKVQLNEAHIYYFEVDEDEEEKEGNGSGRYRDNGQSSTEVMCYNCGKVIGGWRGDGERWGLTNLEIDR